MSHKLIGLTLTLVLGIQAQTTPTIAFKGLYSGDGVDVATAQQYVDCLQKEWLKKGAFNLVSPDDISKQGSGECKADCGRNLGADLVLSGSLSKNATGYAVSLNILDVGADKSQRIDWKVIGTSKDLLGDGCKNGAAVVYNVQVTPTAKSNTKVANNFEAQRDKGMQGGMTGDIVHVKEYQEAAGRGNSQSQKNPDKPSGSDKSGGR